MLLKEEHTLMISSFKDCHLTALHFNRANGHPLLYIIIIAGSEVDANVRMGLQPWYDVKGDLMEYLEENANVIDKFFPFGPT